ncbi:hypothetical protein ACWCQQ_49530 [Streptomyces sp. NPDC002143]
MTSVLVSALARQIAFGGGGREADRQGAAQPFGKVMLWMLILFGGFSFALVRRRRQ